MKIIMKDYRYVIIVLLVISISGCNTPSIDETDRYVPDQQYELTIAHYHESSFNRRYGTALKNGYPNVDIRVIDEGYIDSLNKGNLAEWAETHTPDIIILPSLASYKALADHGILYDLQLLTYDDTLHLTDFIPAALETVQHSSNHTLYGLPTNFSSQALFVNHSLFEQEGVPLPDQPMNWYEILQLAQRFEHNDEVAGWMNRSFSPFGLMWKIAKSEGVTYWDEDTESFVFDSPQWRKIWEAVLPLYQSHNIVEDEFGESFPDNVAMYTGNVLDLKIYHEQKREQEWTVFHYPVDSTSSQGTNELVISNIISILANTENIAVSKEILTFLTGEDVVRYERNSRNDWGLSTRIGTKTSETEALFYDTYTRTTIEVWNEDRAKLHDQVQAAANEKFQQLLENQTTVEQILMELENELHATFNRL